MFDSIKRFFGLFDSNGLKFPLRYLNCIQKDIAFYPIRKQAKHADQMCVEACTNEENIKMSFANFDPEDSEYFNNNVNATSIGNFAYIALHCKDFSIRRKCLKLIINYREFVKNQI